MTQADDRNAADSRLDAALERFLVEGFRLREPKLLQPAGLFLDRLGEDFRGKLYLTGENGELCLRPEYTIPIALGYLDSAEAGGPAALAYGGPIFRANEGEVSQAGLESFGRNDREAADAEILGLALDAAQAAGAPRLFVRLGDAGLVKTFLDRLDLAPAWRRRIAMGLARGDGLASLLAPPARRDKGAGAGVLAALEKSDAAGARKLVEDLLSIAGIATVGGRSAGEIAERFLEQASLENRLADDRMALIEAFFAVEAAPDEASATMRRLAADAKLDLGFALDAFDTRSSFIAARGLALDQMVFATRFPHSIDYYSGFMFEARPEGSGADKPPALSGGRYDRLLRTLGAAQDIPAIGAAIWIDRLAGDAHERF